MSAVVARSWFPIACVLATSGCIQEYRPPTSSEPHAIVKFRRSYEQFAGASLREIIDIGEYRALEATNPAALGPAGRIDAILVHPTPAALHVGSRFFHAEQRMVHETYTVQVPHHEMETYSCGSGFGMNATHRTCTRGVTRYRTETKHRTVWRSVEVTDGECHRSLGFSPMDGRIYLVEYTYQSSGACALSCYEQVPGANGELHQRPCS